MKLLTLNRWDVSPAEARATQARLAPLVVRTGSPRDVQLVAGIDVALPPGETRAAVVVDSYPGLGLVDVATANCPVTFPYVPGLLSFREAPAIVAACEKLSLEPDLVIVDGHGWSHPRRIGIASHIGLILDRPTIGCAKSLLVGKHGPVSENQGDWTPVVDQGEVIGAAVRSRVGVAPIYVSVGNLIGLEPAIAWVLACCRGYRLPEPQRQAHKAAGSR
ncbi:MAG TPA: deoxyribonuclease V [Chloroflexota bacterium]|nr:deoxyribonuclease V [Chloroflexota bacterium]